MRHYLVPDPAEGGDPKPAPAKPDAKPADEQPVSPPAVKKTTIKTPREIELEKKLSETEDRLGTVETALNEVNTFLESSGLRSKPGKDKSGKPIGEPAKPAKKGFLAQVEEDLWGKA